ncbi:MAG: hypothetical protein ACKOXT_02900 [Actinomycetota bacterium]
MLVRRLATSLAVASLALSLSACSITSNVASLQMYAPSDGQQLDLESTKARNFMYLVSETGSGFLIGSLVNSSNRDRMVKVQYPNPETGETSEVVVELRANSKVDFGYNGNAALPIEVAGNPGQTALIYVLESDSVSAGMQVPILDGTLAEYRMLLDQLSVETN